MSNWTTTGTSPLVISSTHNIEPVGGVSSALMDTSADRMHHNLIADNGGSEVSGHTIFTSYIYDDGGAASRIYNEVRGYSGGTGLPNGGTVVSGALAQLFAIGKYSSNTMLGEVWTATKYQARLTFGTTVGWFDLEGPGTPDRSVGWHRFDIERLADGTTINFFVDGVLGRSFTGATLQDWDTVILGPGLGTTVGNAWIDGLSINAIPEPSILALALAGGAGLLRRRRA